MSSIFGHDYQGRKNLPIFSFLTRYFPKALVEVTKVCVAGNAQHNKELALTDINWSRGKSTDQLNTAFRHMMDHATNGPFDQEPPEVLAAIGADESTGTYHLAKAAWRILAELELTIERQQAAKQEALNLKGPAPTVGQVNPDYAKHSLSGQTLVAGIGHTWSDPDKPTDVKCAKFGCGGIHNMDRSMYPPGYLLP